MRVKLVQVDGKYANLGLMKLSAWHKQQGDIVGFKTSNPDIIYASYIFSWNESQVRGVEVMAKLQYPNVDFRIGGPGMGKPNWLPDEVEHIMPDYDLYGLDHSVGFTSRGCIKERQCLFCIVPLIEGLYREHAPFEEFVHPTHKKVVLYDNNFLGPVTLGPSGLATVLEKLEWLRSRKMKVNFSQGLDVRLVTAEIAESLNTTKAWNHNWTRQCMHFAWDFYNKKFNAKIMAGFKTLTDAGIKPWRLTTYVLVGYNTSHSEDLERALTLIEMGIQPYIMKYNNKQDDKWLNHLDRWCNALLYKSVEWPRYLESVQGHTLAPERRASEDEQ